MVPPLNRVDVTEKSVVPQLISIDSNVGQLKLVLLLLELELLELLEELELPPSSSEELLLELELLELELLLLELELLELFDEFVDGVGSSFLQEYKTANTVIAK